MAKPTRKHPFFKALQLSPQGRSLQQIIVQYLGADITYEPIASFDRGRRHLFLLSGTQGSGLLAEAWEEPEEEETRPTMGFTAVTPTGDQVVADYQGYRWDAGMHLQLTGEEPFPNVSKAEAKRRETQRQMEIASEKDQITIVRGRKEWDSLAGISRADVEGVIDLESIPPATGLGS